MSDKGLVLVTGASGFIALHCIQQLLQEGYSVRGTLRSPGREAEVRETVGRNLDVEDRLSFVTANLEADDGWAQAVEGCGHVLHLASPFPPKTPNHEDELIVPARDGALRVLAAAAGAGVKRVVMTSSMAAIAYGHGPGGGRRFNEDDWTDVNDSSVGAYEKSKTIAERAAWDFMAGDEAGEMELTVINPSLVMGPVLNADASTSAEPIRRLMMRELPACPRLGFSMVDVRDVASAHVAAMTAPEAAGKRFCCSDEFAWLGDVAAILAKNYNDKGYRVPTGRMPDWLFRLAAMFDKSLRLVVRSLGHKNEIDSSRLRDTLGWTSHGVEEMTLAMADSLIEFGIVKPKR